MIVLTAGPTSLSRLMRADQVVRPGGAQAGLAATTATDLSPSGPQRGARSSAPAVQRR